MGIIREFFTGRNDKYAGKTGIYHSLPAPDSSETVYNKRYTKSVTNWKAYYRSRHQEARTKDNNIKDMGTVGAYIDRIVSFCHSKGWELKLEDAAREEQGMQEIFDFVKHVQKENPTKQLSVEGGYSCAVDGDAFFAVQPVVDEGLLKDYDEDLLTALNNNVDKAVKLIVLNPLHVYDFMLSPDGRTITYICIKYPITKLVDGKRKDSLFVQEITPEQITERVEDYQGNVLRNGETRDNPIGAVYVVHIKNFPLQGKWGFDDVQGLLGPSDELNAKIANVSTIIDYHEEPTTVLFGARAKTLEKGAKKMWSGLPANAKIEVLKNEADLEATVKFLAELKKSLQQQSGVNDAALGSEDLVSNVSGAAMELRFYSLLSRAELKWAAWEPGIKKVVSLILMWGKYFNHVNFTAEQARAFLGALSVTFKSNLPTNVKEAVQNSTAKLKAGISTFSAELREHGVQDPDKAMTMLQEEVDKHPVLAGVLGLQNLVTDQANKQRDDKQTGNVNQQGAIVDPPEPKSVDDEET